MTERADIAGRYRIIRPLGKGAVGTVFLAFDSVEGIPVAVKSVRPRAAGQLEKEFLLLSELRHPGLCRVLDFGFKDPGRREAFLVSEYVPGAPLCGATAPALEPRLALSVAVQLFQALAYLHGRSITHGDIKPTNLLLSADGRLKVVDFHTARLSTSPSGAVGGTPLFWSPELLAGLRREALPGDDLFAAGVALYWALAGNVPFLGLDARSIEFWHRTKGPLRPATAVEGVPRELNELVAGLTEPKVENRISSASEALSVLGAELKARPQIEGWVHFVGRKQEKGVLLEQALQTALRRRQPVLVVLQGPAGSGKTRLLKSIIPQLKTRGLTVEAFWEAGRIPLRHYRAKRVEGTLNQRLRAVIESFGKRPAYLLLDGIPARKWLPVTGLLEDPRSSPLVVVWAVRSGENLPKVALKSADFVLRLSGLSLQELSFLACDFCRASDIAPELVRELLSASGGLPGRAMELLRASSRSGALRVNEAGVLHGLRPLEEESEKAPAPPDHLLAALAVPLLARRAVPYSMLRKTLGARGDEKLSEALNRGLLVELPGGEEPLIAAAGRIKLPAQPPGAVRYVLLRAAALTARSGDYLTAARLAAACPGARRSSLQLARRAVRTLRKGDPEACLQAAELLWKLSKGGRSSERVSAGLRFLAASLRAGKPPPEPVKKFVCASGGHPLAEACGYALCAQAAEAAGDFKAAADLAEKARTSLERRLPFRAVNAELSARTGWLLLLAGIRPQAEKAFEQARVPPPPPGSLLFRFWYRGQATVAVGLGRLGFDSEAEKVLSDLLAFEGVPGDLALRPLSEKAIREAERGRRREADRLFRKIIKVASEVGDAGAEVGAALNRAILAYKERDLQKAARLFEDSLKRSLRYGETALRPAVWCGLATVFRLKGRFTEAVKLFRKVLSMTGVRSGLVINAKVNLGEVYQLLGVGEKALEVRREAVRAAVELGDPYLKSLAWFGLAVTEAHQGLFDRETFAQAESLACERKDFRFRAGVKWARAQFAESEASRSKNESEREKRLRKAVRLYGEGLAQAVLGADSDYRSASLLGLLRTLLRLGKTEAARRVAAKLCAIESGRPLPWEVAGEIRLWRLYFEAGSGAVSRSIRSLYAEIDRLTQSCELSALCWFLTAVLIYRQQPSSSAWVLPVLKAFGELDTLRARGCSGAQERLLDLVRSLCSGVLQPEKFPWAGLTARVSTRAYEVYALYEGRPLCVARNLTPLQHGVLAASGVRIPGLKRLELSAGCVVTEESASLDRDIAQAVVRAFLLVEETFKEVMRRLSAEESHAPQGGGAETETIKSRAAAVRAVRRVAEAAPSEEGRFVAGSGPLASVLRRLPQIASSPLPVLLLGESGTGKDLAARVIHRLSRPQGPFVAISCGDLPAGLVEAELFGVKKGAFTGADRDRPGLLKAASGGTLYLDAVEELPQRIQAALLRVLEAGELRPLGGGETVRVSFRLIAASRLPLPELQKVLRDDFYYRLSGFTLSLPPLRDCSEDIAQVAAELLRRWALRRREPVPTLRPEAIERLKTRSWPGNVRELANVLERALLRKADRQRPGAPLQLEAADLSEAEAESAVATPMSTGTLADARQEAERSYLQALLERFRGNVAACARQAGVTRRHLSNLLKRYKLDPDRYRGKG